MNHIGKIVQEFRLLRRLNRKDLAKNICTEKYIYLIENGQRTPSINLLRLISERLKVDLFDYYKFLDCNDPIRVCKVINHLALCQRNSDFIRTEKIVRVANSMPDFQCKPWIYILKANQVACKVFNERKYAESINELTNIIKGLEKEYVESIYVFNIYILLSTCYQILGHINEAKNITLKANDIIEGKESRSDYEHFYITSKLNLLTLYYLTREFDKAIHVGEELIKFQQRAHSLSRSHYAFAFLAFSYYEEGIFNKAFAYLNKTIFSLMTNYNPHDAYYIMCQDTFNSMSKDKLMNEKVLELFFEMYGKN